MSRSLPPTAPLVASLLALVALTGCAGTTAGAVDRRVDPAGSGGNVITPVEIARSGANDAFQAIERGGTYLLIADVGGGRPVRISRRGASSLSMGNAVLLVVDGTPVSHTQEVLRSIPASSIRYIRILSGREAALEWGSEAANGVIVVATSAR